MAVRQGCGTEMGLRGAAHLGTLLVLASSMAHMSSNEVDLLLVGSHLERASSVAWSCADPGKWLRSIAVLLDTSTVHVCMRLMQSA